MIKKIIRLCKIVMLYFAYIPFDQAAPEAKLFEETIDSQIKEEDYKTKETPFEVSAFWVKNPDYKKIFHFKDFSIQVKRFEQDYQKIKLLHLLSAPDLYLFKEYEENFNFLPKIYAALIHLTGLPTVHTNYLSSPFFFNFLLQVIKEQEKTKYSYQIWQEGTFIKINVYQIVDLNDVRQDDQSYFPNDSSFSKQNIIDFSLIFFQHLLDELEKEKYIPENFLATNFKSFFLFGYLDNNYFSKSYINIHQYKKEYQKLKKQLYEEKKISIDENLLILQSDDSKLSVESIVLSPTSA